MYKLMLNYFNEDAGYFMTDFIAISDDIDKLKSKAIETADKTAQQGYGTHVWDQQWESKISNENQIYYTLNLGEKYDDSYLISEETPL